MNMCGHRSPDTIPDEEPVPVTLLLQDHLLQTDFYLLGHTFEFTLIYTITPLEKPEMSSPAGSHHMLHVLIPQEQTLPGATGEALC